MRRDVNHLILLGLVVVAFGLTGCGGGSGGGGGTTPINNNVGSGGGGKPPIASAGLDKAVFTNTLVTLDGSASSDPDGDLLNYSWEVVSTPDTSRSGAFPETGGVTNWNISTLAITPSLDGEYTFRLQVNDGVHDSDWSYVKITAKTNPPNFNVPKNLQANNNTSYAFNNEHYVWQDRYSAFTSEFWLGDVGYGDFTGDGIDDALVARIGKSNPVDPPAPLRFYRGLAGGGYVQDDSIFEGTIPATDYPYSITIADFNGDGKLDAWIADNGLDMEPFPGAAPLELLSTPGGKLRTIVRTDLKGYCSQTLAGDLDGDGDIDLIMLQDGNDFVPPGGRDFGHDRFLINDGTGNFTEDNTRWRTSTDSYWNHSAYNGGLFDIDGDGWLDVAIGGHEWPYNVVGGGGDPVIFWGSGTGSYGAIQTAIPEVPGFGFVEAFAFEDVDGDGKVDVIIMREPGDNGYGAVGGRTFQILMNQGNRIFTDESSTRINPLTNNLAGTYPHFWAKDVNGDGKIDFVGENRDGTGQPVSFFLLKNDGTGHFTFVVKGTPTS